ncbi:MAG TPA: hypothetical protein VG842_11210, partial [Sediminibacterium sp.]|nr:hypothetical protein [Sediminibacterium sp.]
WLFNRHYRILMLKKNHLLFKIHRDNSEHTILEEREKFLLKTLLENSEKNKVTPIEEINQILGIGRRTIEVQKKQRSDTITSLNKNTQLYIETPIP